MVKKYTKEELAKARKHCRKKPPAPKPKKNRKKQDRPSHTKKEKENIRKGVTKFQKCVKKHLKKTTKKVCAPKKVCARGHKSTLKYPDGVTGKVFSNKKAMSIIEEEKGKREEFTRQRRMILSKFKIWVKGKYTGGASGTFHNLVVPWVPRKWKVASYGVFKDYLADIKISPQQRLDLFGKTLKPAPYGKEFSIPKLEDYHDPLKAAISHLATSWAGFG